MKSWERRGHTRKPNAIVRGIYVIADWCGDFGYLANQAKQGLISTGLVVTNFIILLGILITSAVHSLELLRYAGATHGIEYILLIVFEALFLFSSLLLDQAFKRGIASIKKSWHVWLPFLIGLVFVFFSNFLGMAQNYAGWIIGGITPVLLLSVKWMLYWQLNVRAKFDAEARNKKSEEISDEKSVEISSENTAETAAESEKNLAEKTEDKTEDKTETSPSVSSDSANKNLKKNDQKRLQKTTQKDVRKPEESAAESEQKTEKTSKKSSKRNRKKRTRNRDREIQKAVEVIKKELEETGEIPTYATITTLAKTTKHYAQQAKRLVEAELKQKEAQQQEQQEEQEEQEESKQQLLEKAS